MGLGLCLSDCCGTCNICDHKKVPEYIDVTMSGWTDSYIDDSHFCVFDASGSQLVSPNSELNTTIRCYLSAAFSDADYCCATYLGEMDFSSILRESLTVTVDYDCPPPDFDTLTMYSIARYTGNKIGIVVTVSATGTPSEVFVRVGSTARAIDDVLLDVNCVSPSEITGGLTATVDRDWFCLCDGDTGNLCDVADLPFDGRFYIQDSGASTLNWTDNYAGEATYTGDVATSVVLTASCTRVAIP